MLRHDLFAGSASASPIQRAGSRGRPGRYSKEFWRQLTDLGLLVSRFPSVTAARRSPPSKPRSPTKNSAAPSAPSPHFVSIGLLAARSARSRRQTTAQQEEWLPKVATGKTILTSRGSSRSRPTAPTRPARAETDATASSSPVRSATFTSQAQRIASCVLARTGRARRTRHLPGRPRVTGREAHPTDDASPPTRSTSSS